MKAKEYLRQAFCLNRRIASDVEEMKELRELAESVTSPQYGERVQTSPSYTAPFVRSIEKLVDLEAKIADELDRLVDLKTEIRETIDRVEDADQRMLLRYRYIHFHTWEEIADEMNYGLRWVYIIHGHALDSVNRILKECSRIHYNSL